MLCNTGGVTIKATAGDADADWQEATRDAMRALIGEKETAGLLDRVLPIIPAGYDELNWPNSAAIDLPIVDRLGAATDASATELETAMLHFVEAADNEWRFRVYHAGSAVPIADLLPLLDHLGFRAIDERAFHFELGPRGVWLHDVGVQVPESVSLTEQARAEVQRAFVAEFNETVEVDGLNRLVLLAGLSAREVEILRAYSRYLRQIGFPFSQQYIETTLGRHAEIAAGLVRLFSARFTPQTSETRDESQAIAARGEIAEALDAVPTLDDDRTLRALLALIEATVRTNAFRPGPNAGYRDVIAFKFDPA